MLRQSKVFPGIILDRDRESRTPTTCQISYEDHVNYEYHNLTSVILIYNYLANDAPPDNIERVFTTFMKRMTGINQIVEFFNNHLKEFIIHYISLKFSNVESIMIKESVDLMVDFFPAFCWFDNSLMKLQYDPDRIKKLLNRYVAIMTISGDLFVPDASDYKKQTIEHRQSEYEIAAEELSTRAFVPNPPKQKTPIPVLGWKRMDDKKPSYTNDCIQRNIQEIWNADSKTKLQVLMGIVGILEQIVSSLTEADNINMVPLYVISFPRTTHSIMKMASKTTLN